MNFSIGLDNLEERDAIVVRAVVKLRPESWGWVSALGSADVWLVDMTRSLLATPQASLREAKVIQLVGDDAPAVPAGEAGLLLKPVKAARLMRQLDLAVARGPVAPRQATPGVAARSPKPVAVTAPPPAPTELDSPVGHPFRGKLLRFLRSPNLARYPVTAEMLGILERMSKVGVAYETIERVLPLDMKLVDEIFSDATREGYLVDGQGLPLPPVDKPARKAFRLFK